MVMLQVDQVDRLFEEVDRLRSNNWKEVRICYYLPATRIKKFKISVDISDAVVEYLAIDEMYINLFRLLLIFDSTKYRVSQP